MPNEHSEVEGLTALSYRLRSVEQEIIHIKAALSLYVPVRENDLQSQSIKNTVERIEHDVSEIRSTQANFTTQIVTQNASQRESQDQLQIRVLKYIVMTGVGVFLTVSAGLLIAFFTHVL